MDADASLIKQLEDSGYPTKFITPALQLSNNRKELAAELIQKMMARDVDLKGDGETKDSVTEVPFSHTAPVEVSPSSSTGNLADGAKAHKQKVSPHRKMALDPFTGMNTLMTDGGVDIEDLSGESEDDNEHEGSMNSPLDNGSVCCECQKDEPIRRDQLVPCSACRREFHTFCLGRRAVPFSLRTNKERQGREKFITKNYR